MNVNDIKVGDILICISCSQILDANIGQSYEVIKIKPNRFSPDSKYLDSIWFKNISNSEAEENSITRMIMGHFFEIKSSKIKENITTIKHKHPLTDLFLPEEKYILTQ